jgi:hypothetical protein
MENNLLLISIVINLVLLLFGGYIIHKKGGFAYLKRKFITQNDYETYYYAKKSIFEIMPNDTSEIIFLGDSIIDFCNWHELFGKYNIKNRGISGDIINGVIDRLEEIVESKPKKIFLMIGTNDLGKKISVDNILSEYEKLVNLILVRHLRLIYIFIVYYQQKTIQSEKTLISLK